MLGPANRWNDLKAIVTLTYKDSERKHLALAAAGMAFYFLMSLVPALALLAAVMAYLPRLDSAQALMPLLARVMPVQALNMLEDVVTTVNPHRTALLSFGIIVTLWLASVGGQGIISSLDIVYDVRSPRPMWINRILACGLTLAVGGLLLLAVAVTLLGPLIERALSALVPVQSWWLAVWPLLQWLVAAAFTFAAILMLLLLAPNVRAAERIILPGALIAALAWMALSWGLGFYLQYFGQLKLDRFYGVFATPMAVMIWLYWGAAAILLGAQVNASLQTWRNQRRAESPPRESTARIA